MTAVAKRQFTDGIEKQQQGQEPQKGAPHLLAEQGCDEGKFVFVGKSANDEQADK